MNEDEYLNMRDELESLRKNLVSMMQVHEGKCESFTNVEEAMDELFEKISIESKGRENG